MTQNASEKLIQDKQQIRRLMLTRRAALSQEDKDEAADRLCQQLTRLVDQYKTDGLHSPLKIAVYAPFRDELDLSVCFSRLIELPAALFFPKIINDGHSSAIHFYQLPDGLLPSSWLRPGHFGVSEPPVLTNEDKSDSAIISAQHEDTTDKAACDVTLFDLMLIPGLAFDRDGYRLGWGKAYYDHYLSRLEGVSPRPCLIGVGYSFQLLDTLLPRQAHDVPLDAVITPDAIHSCSCQV